MLNLFLMLDDVATADPATGGGITTYIYLGVMIVILIGMFVFSSRSQKKRQKKMEEMITSLKVGNKVKTIGGIYGVIVETCDDGGFIIETGLKGKETTIKIDKGAIYASDDVQIESNEKYVKPEDVVEEDQSDDNTNNTTF